MQIHSQKTRISATFSPRLVTELKRVAEKEGTPQSAILEKALSAWLSNRLAHDAQALAKLSYDDLPSENEWLELQSSIA